MELAFGSAEQFGDCLLVTHWATNGRGYARGPRIDERPVQLMHRLVVEDLLGRRLAPEETVDHLCHNADPTCKGGYTDPHRRCINPEHLGITDAVTNWLRADTWARRRL